MAWTVPIRWTVNTTVTAAQLNTGLRDNLNATETSTATTAGDMIYATAKNTLTRLASGSARTALMVASGGTAPEWKHSFYPIQIGTTPSTLGVGVVGAPIFESKVIASHLGENDSIFATFFITIYNNSASTLVSDIYFYTQSGGTTENIGYWIPANTSHTTSSTSRGGWYSAWIVGKGTSTSRNVFLVGPRNASAMPLFGATTDIYFIENTSSKSGCLIGIYYTCSPPFPDTSITVHYAGIWSMRAI